MSREKLDDDDDDDDEEDDDDSEDEEDPDGRVIKGRKREEGVEKGARRVPAREREREGRGGGQEAIGMSDRISLVNQIWPNKRRDGRNARENGGPREQLRFVRALACGRAAKKSVKPKRGGNGMEDEPFESGQLWRERERERGE